ncbi:Putative N-acetylmannosamine-6-phosphate 2-epimerase [Vibrio mimicus VM603]|uniref:N-acylglucosamine-6-phosphate 2-epimerase n=5 Tax=Vibrio TaxID=662 RepID=D2YCT5_VIBMI|nr:Putative N-acetylmannosamine-6-phosphate 2-epimerase [Vibrio mimicus VM603]CSI68052.1 N-acetylmannosamine-6-phosphate 2-epimerase [Vibrio cholerae]
MAEGRYNTPELAAKAIESGAVAVTVGSALTRLEVVTQWFNNATQAAGERKCAH